MQESLLYLGLIFTLWVLSEVVNYFVGGQEPTTAPKSSRYDLSKVNWEYMMLGVGVGDAFGAGIEMKSREWMEQVDFTSYLNERPPEWQEGFSKGKYTDDTEMTIGMMKLLMSGKEVTPDTMVEAWLEEYNEGKKKYGFGRQGHGSILRYYNGEVTIEQVRDWQRVREYPGNAPPMRAVPLAFTGDKLYEYAIMNADSTHPHPKARASSVLIARAAQYLILDRKDPMYIIRELNSESEIKELDQETFEYLNEVDRLPAYNIGGSKYSANDPKNIPSNQQMELLCGPQPIQPFNINGLNADAMRTAGCVLYILKYYTDPMTTLRICIRIGGDVDSLGSICLGIVGARYGLAGLSKFMFSELEDYDGLKKLGRSFGEYVNATLN